MTFEMISVFTAIHFCYKHRVFNQYRKSYISQIIHNITEHIIKLNILEETNLLTVNDTNITVKDSIKKNLNN